MIIRPRVRGFICVTAHPAGCAANVRRQADVVRSRGPIENGPSRVLVIGASTGYGLASRIAAAEGSGASTIGVFFEREGTATKTATAGWYNTAAFHELAADHGLYTKSINGDAFSDEIKQRTIDLITADLGTVDLIVYSLAAPRRSHPVTGTVHAATLKPIGQPVSLAGIDTDKEVVKTFTIPAASDQEIADTVAVMGGDDWERWIDALAEADVLAAGAKTTAYTYVGDTLTRAVYWDGTIGAAKKDLDRRVGHIRSKMAAVGGDARVSVLKAVVTQSSSAIPIMPLYLSLLFRAMSEDGTDEGCIQQVDRLFRECLYGEEPRMDGQGRYRVDERELAPHVQAAVAAAWGRVDDGNLHDITDFRRYQREFLQLFGFGVVGIDYEADVNPVFTIDDVVPETP